MKFTHVHVHSHYSILDGMSKVPDLVDKCMRNGMRSMALTDHGSMFGIKEFVDYSNKVNKKIQEKIGELEAELKTADDAKNAIRSGNCQTKRELFQTNYWRRSVLRAQ